MSKVPVLYALRSLGSRLSERSKFDPGQGKCCSLERTACSLERALIWAVSKLRFLNPFFIQKPNFDPPITQIDLQKRLQVLYTTYHQKQLRKTQSTTWINNIRQFIIFLKNLNQNNNSQSKFMKHAYILLIELLAHPYLIRWTIKLQKFKLSLPSSNPPWFLVLLSFLPKLKFSSYWYVQ